MTEHDDDRFGDLGAQPPRSRAEEIGEQLAERDRTHPEPDTPRPQRPEVPRASNKYAWLVGILMLMGIAVLLLTTALPNKGAGIEGPARRSILKDFAAPSATGTLEGDTNVCQKRPCPKNSGQIPACQVHGASVVNICDLRSSPLVLTFVFDKGADCFPEVDRTERAAARVPGVRFATVVFTRKDHNEIKSIVKNRRWKQPVAVDSDGALVNLYSVGGCPTTVFAHAGGRVSGTKLGDMTEDEIVRRAARLRRPG